MGHIPVLSDAQLAAFRQMLNSNHRVNLTPQKAKPIRRQPVYHEKKAIPETTRKPFEMYIENDNLYVSRGIVLNSSQIDIYDRTDYPLDLSTLPDGAYRVCICNGTVYFVSGYLSRSPIFYAIDGLYEIQIGTISKGNGLVYAQNTITTDIHISRLPRCIAGIPFVETSDYTQPEDGEILTAAIISTADIRYIFSAFVLKKTMVDIAYFIGHNTSCEMVMGSCDAINTIEYISSHSESQKSSIPAGNSYGVAYSNGLIVASGNASAANKYFSINGYSGVSQYQTGTICLGIV